MKKRNHVIAADMCFLAVVLLLFAGMVYLPFDYNNYSFDVIVLCLAVLLFIITYFTSYRVGIVLNMIFIFLFLAYAIADALRQGKTVGLNTYFWIFWPAATNLAISGYVWQNRLLGEENRELNGKLEQLATIDEETQMNNLLAFERDARVYMNISRRYRLELVLILWKLASQEEVERLVGKSNMQEVVNSISDVAKERLRGEDLIYMVEKDPYTWGALLFTNSGSVDMVRKRIEQAITGVKVDRFTRQKAVVLDLTAAVKIYDGGLKTPLAFLAETKQEFAGSRTWRQEVEEERAAAGRGGAGTEKSRAAAGQNGTGAVRCVPGAEQSGPETAETRSGAEQSGPETAETRSAEEQDGRKGEAVSFGRMHFDDFDIEIREDDDWDV